MELWQIFIAEVIPVAMLGIIIIVLVVRMSDRISNMEWLTTERADMILAAREAQKAAEAAQEKLRMMRGKAPTSRPVAFSISTPPGDPWLHNGHHE